MGRIYRDEDVSRAFEEERKGVKILIEFTREVAGSQPATDDGLRAFIKHHLGIDPETQAQEFEECLARIKKEEIGERDITPKNDKGESGEVEEAKVYGVNVLRSTGKGAYIGAHQIKACFKACASRLGFFVGAKGKLGPKGDLAEFGTALAAGDSLLDPERPWEIYLVDKSGKPAKTHWGKIMGSVQSSSGRKSIMYDCEMAPAGTRLEFVFRYPPRNFSEEKWLKIVGAAKEVGLGAVKSLDYGRFKVLEMKFVD
jgi:hypothetical protein